VALKLLDRNNGVIPRSITHCWIYAIAIIARWDAQIEGAGCAPLQFDLWGDFVDRFGFDAGDFFQILDRTQRPILDNPLGRFLADSR
jgi:hypothetical protein